ncbi:MAG: hypothetical protein HQM08_21340 [Candidatus Riflebacteria bacterium]|nr:hypothetical protein [Candidatus Riflebacteria bacterium]
MIFGQKNYPPFPSYRLFEKLFRRAISRIPRVYRKDVGVFALHKKTLNSPEKISGLFILGTYQPAYGWMEPTVSLYYGSFRRIFSGADLNRIFREIKKTLLHELLHHWEHKAGRDELSEEDRYKLQALRIRAGRIDPEKERKRIIEALLFVYIVFLSIAIAAKILD